MNDTWGELWKEISIDGITQTSNISNSWVRNILNRIKVEGDNLKAKADILDRVEEMGVVTVYDSKHWSTDFNVLEQKLEAIQNWFNDWINPWMLLLNKDEDGFQLSKKRMISLKEIPEGETLQNIGESQT